MSVSEGKSVALKFRHPAKLCSFAQRSFDCIGAPHEHPLIQYFHAKHYGSCGHAWQKNVEKNVKSIVMVCQSVLYTIYKHLLPHKKQ